MSQIYYGYQVETTEVERLIKRSGKKGITKNRLYRLTRNISNIERNEAINKLLFTNKIIVKKETVIINKFRSQRGTQPTIYYWNK